MKTKKVLIAWIIWLIVCFSMFVIHFELHRNLIDYTWLLCVILSSINITVLINNNK